MGSNTPRPAQSTARRRRRQHQTTLMDFHPSAHQKGKGQRVGLVAKLLSALSSRNKIAGIKGKRISLGNYAMSNPSVVFNQLDVDKSGGIDLDELREACEEMGLGLDDGQLREIMAALDIDGDASISMDEFKQLSHLVQGKYRRGQGRCKDPGNPDGLSDVFAMYNELERLVNLRRPPELIQQLFAALMMLVSPIDATREEVTACALFTSC